MASAVGTTYLTAGGGGQTGYPTSLAPMSYVTIDGARVPEAAPWSAVRYNDNSLLVLDVDGGRLSVRALRSDGTEIERFTLLRSHSRVPRGRFSRA